MFWFWVGGEILRFSNIQFGLKRNKSKPGATQNMQFMEILEKQIE